MARSRGKKRVVSTRRKKTNNNNSNANNEVSLLGKVLRSLGTGAGSVVGGMLGAPVTGAAAGHGLGAAISKWMGSGDYSVSKNSLVARASTSIPDMHNAHQTVTVRHKEYLGQIPSSQNFTVQGFFPLNPGRADTFPWLTSIARRFQEYSFKGIVFHYVPTSGSISTTQALGSVMMQTTYRTTDSAPASKIEMLNEYWSCETVPFETLAHPIECDPKENPFNIQYVRTGEVPSTESKLSYDLGTMYIATSGQSTNGTILGDIWVTYEVELKKPVLSSNVTTAAQVAGRRWTGAALTASAFFDGTLAYNDGTLAVSFAGRTITFGSGVYGRFYISITIGSTAGLTGPIDWTAASTLTNCTLQDYFGNPATGLQVLGIKNTAATAELNSYYTIAVDKVSGDTVATILLPTITVGGGVIHILTPEL